MRANCHSSGNPSVSFYLKNRKPMKFLDLVKARYSCRSYQDRQVEQEKLDYIMECVRFAPSAVNRQPWRFRIVTEAESKEKLQQCYHRDWFNTAPLYMMASILHDEAWVRADGKPHGDIDIAIAVEHLCLAASEQGLATCWVCNFDAALCRSLFSLPENEKPAVLIPIGYAADEPKEKKRKAMSEILLPLQ
jgi:nitroreductase